MYCLLISITFVGELKNDKMIIIRIEV